MPPVAGHEHGLAGVLDALNPVRYQPSTTRTFCLLEPWQNEVKILDCLVVFALFYQVLATHKVLVDVFAWWNEQPSFPSCDASVPRRRAQRVLVDLAARSFGSDQEPSMRWGLLFSKEFREQILSEKLGWQVFRNHVFRLRVIFK